MTWTALRSTATSQDSSQYIVISVSRIESESSIMWMFCEGRCEVLIESTLRAIARVTQRRS